MTRTILVGDVHGCAAELSDLLDRARFEATDQLVSVGDLVARGPDTKGVLDLMRRHRGRAVVGNHELKLLDARKASARGEPLPSLGPTHAALMEELTGDDWEYLQSLPAYLDLPEHDVRVVHAGVMPGVPIETQDVEQLAYMRSLDASGRPRRDRLGILWGALYRDRPHVVFGHNATDGLQLHLCATGLDTGCVYGNELTALVLAEGQSPLRPEVRHRQLISVRARGTYYDPFARRRD